MASRLLCSGRRAAAGCPIRKGMFFNLFLLYHSYCTLSSYHVCCLCSHHIQLTHRESQSQPTTPGNVRPEDPWSERNVLLNHAVLCCLTIPLRVAIQCSNSRAESRP